MQQTTSRNMLNMSSANTVSKQYKPIPVPLYWTLDQLIAQIDESRSKMPKQGMDLKRIGVMQ